MARVKFLKERVPHEPILFRFKKAEIQEVLDGKIDCLEYLKTVAAGNQHNLNYLGSASVIHSDDDVVIVEALRKSQFKYVK